MKLNLKSPKLPAIPHLVPSAESLTEPSHRAFQPLLFLPVCLGTPVSLKIPLHVTGTSNTYFYQFHFCLWQSPRPTEACPCSICWKQVITHPFLGRRCPSTMGSVQKGARQLPRQPQTSQNKHYQALERIC